MAALLEEWKQRVLRLARLTGEVDSPDRHFTGNSVSQDLSSTVAIYSCRNQFMLFNS
jgi:hypothetical protein